MSRLSLNHQSASQLVSRSVSWSVCQSVCQSVSQSVRQSVRQSTGRYVSLIRPSASHLSSQTVSQPVLPLRMSKHTWTEPSLVVVHALLVGFTAYMVYRSCDCHMIYHYARKPLTGRNRPGKPGRDQPGDSASIRTS